MGRPRADAPITLCERAVALDARSALRLAAEDVGGRTSVALYVESADAGRAVEPLLRVPPRALRELARALDRLAGELGVQP